MTSANVRPSVQTLEDWEGRLFKAEGRSPRHAPRFGLGLKLTSLKAISVTSPAKIQNFLVFHLRQKINCFQLGYAFGHSPGPVQSQTGQNFDRCLHAQQRMQHLEQTFSRYLRFLHALTSNFCKQNVCFLTILMISLSFTLTNKTKTFNIDIYIYDPDNQKLNTIIPSQCYMMDVRAVLSVHVTYLRFLDCNTLCIVLILIFYFYNVCIIPIINCVCGVYPKL